MKDIDRKFFDRRISAMETERSSFIDHWKELSEFILPRRGRFFLNDRNKGDKRNQKIINSRATQAIKTARAGLVSGVMSPSRPWFELETEDQELMDRQDVRVWLEEVKRRMLGVFNRSNLFNMAPVMLGELLLFGTGAMSHVDDEDQVARFFAHPVGSYLIGQNDRYEVNSFVREFEMTVEQIVSQFGTDNISATVKNHYDKGEYDPWIPIVQYIGDNPQHDSKRVDGISKPIVSVYYERDNNDKDQFLRKSGFDEFPVYVPRWDVTGEDIYGTDCPGMIALSDVKQLQIEERRKAQAIDKMVNPPLKGPASIRNVPVSSLPGGLTIYDSDVQRETLQPIYTVEPRLQEMMADMQAIERRVNEAFYVDLFFAISNMEGIQPKNQLELTQRNQERLLQLGPVLERLHSEFLNKMIDRTFNQLNRKNMLPDPPEALEGQELRVQFVSTLAMAQRSSAIGAINEMSMYIGQMGQMFPEALDKFNVDQSIDELSLITGVPPNIIRGDDEVSEMRQQRAEQQQQQQAMQVAMEAGQGVMEGMDNG